MSGRKLLALLALGIAWLPAYPRTVGESEPSTNYLSLGGVADWEIFRSDGVSQGTRATFDALRQKYSLTLNGVLWDPRFNRFSLGVDLFRDDRSVNGEELDSQSFGYRTTTTFFPARSFPLVLFARRSTVDSTGIALADSDRETSAWGAEWNLTTAKQQNMRLQFDRTSYDLVSPLAVRERRRTGNFEFTQRWSHRETSFHYAFEGQKELVRASDFVRQSVYVNDRTRFDNGATLLLNGSRTSSDAVFSTGETDELTVDRASIAFDVPRRERVGVNVNYNFNGNDGKFVDSTSHYLNARVRIAMGHHWESDTGVTLGTLDTASSGTDIRQDVAGVNLAVRYNRDWKRVHLGSAYTLGLNRTTFNSAQDRSVTNHSLDAEVRVPFHRSEEFLASASVQRDQNDTTGIGFTFDEARASLGIGSQLAESVPFRASVFGREATYDTFQFGVQDSREFGLEGSLGWPGGGASVAVSTQKGVSDFIPDPASSNPFLPGTDLVNRADIATVGARWRLFRRLGIRVQARLEDRSFTSIGNERILYYHPQVDWSHGPWMLSLGLSHYERSNQTTFRQDTLLLKITRRFF